MEQVAYDRQSGQLLSASFMDYAMPRADVMCNIDIHENPVPTKTNPLGAKGAGEAGCVGALPAVMIAIMNALEPLGVHELAKMVRWYSPAEALKMATADNGELMALSGFINPYPGKLGVVEDAADSAVGGRQSAGEYQACRGPRQKLCRHYEGRHDLQEYTVPVATLPLSLSSFRLTASGRHRPRCSGR